MIDKQKKAAHDFMHLHTLLAFTNVLHIISLYVKHVFYIKSLEN